MASRKNLKKDIRYATDWALDNALKVLLFKKDVDAEAVRKLILDICACHDEAIVRISHVEKGNEKAFLDSVRKYYVEGLDAFYEGLEKLA
jgi:hypothetical protein